MITDTRHPDYENFINDYNFYYDHYKGGREFIRKDYLWKYDLEPNGFYRTRKKRAVYHNYCSSIVGTYVHYIFSRGIIRQQDSFEDFINDCNLRGITLNEFMKNKVAVASLVFGHTFVFIDMPKFDNIKTQYQAKEAKIRPYLIHITPLDLLDWSFDEWGNPYFVKWREAAPDITNPEDEHGDSEDYYRVWTREEWFLYNDRGEKVDTGINPLGIIPIVPVYAGNNEWDFKGESLLKDIAGLNNRIYNWESEIDEGVNKQMFSQLVLKTTDQANDIGVGRSAMLKLNPDNNEDVFYVSPDVSPLSTVADLIERNKKEIYRIAMKQSKSGTETAVAESGISKAFDFEQTNRALSNISQSWENAEEQIFRFVNLWQGTSYDIFIEYPRTFDIFNFTNELQDMLTINTIGSPSQTFVNEIWKKFVQKKLPQVNKETKDKIITEIESKIQTKPGLDLTK